MSLVPLYATVKTFPGYNTEDDEVFYIFDETKVGASLYVYEGAVGYGCTAQEYIDYQRDHYGEEISGDDDFTTGYVVPVKLADTRSVRFTFDSETKILDVQCCCRLGGGSEFVEAVRALPANVELVMPTDEEILAELGKQGKPEEHMGRIFEHVKAELAKIQERVLGEARECTLDFRFPRTKDSIPINIVFNHMFASVSPIRIRYNLIYNAY
jgi:hypothetical protein